MPGPRTYQITRPRPSLSCLVCRQRKVRCDRQHPSCGYCLKIKQPCQYDNNNPALKKGSQKSQNPSAALAEQDRSADRPHAQETISGGASTRSDGTSSAASEYSWQQWGNNEDGHGLPPEVETRAGESSSANNELQQNSAATDDTASHSSGGSCSASTSSGRSGNASHARPVVGGQPRPVGWRQNRYQSTSSLTSATSRSSGHDRSGGPSTGISMTQAPVSGTTHTPRKRVRKPTDPAAEDQVAPPPQNDLASAGARGAAFQSRGHLNIQGGGQMRYVGGGFWGFAKGHELLCDALLTDEENRGSGDQPQPYIDSNGLAGILGTLPPKSVCDAFLYSFLVGVRPILPLIHVPTFRTDYNDYWNWYSTVATGECNLPNAKLLADPTYLCLLFAVIFCGATTASSSIWAASTLQGVNREEIIAQLKSSLQACQNFCRHLQYPTHNTLLASLLAHECSTQRRDGSEDAEFVSTVLRIARGMGMHRDGKVLGLDPVVSEIRRRAWWHILWLDVEISVRTGSPTLCNSNPSQQDVQMVSQVRDEDILQLAGLPSSTSLPSPSSIIMLFVTGQYETARFEHTLISHINGTQGLNQVQFDEFVKSMRKLHLQIDEIVNKIPAQGLPEKGLIPARIANAAPLVNEKLYSDTSTDPTVFMSWARIMLTMLKAGTTFLLLVPLLERPDLDKNSIQSIWTSVIRVSTTYLRHYLQLTSVPSFEPYAWCLLNHRTSLQCVFLILIYLHNHPNTPQSHLARYFADEVIDLFTCEELSNSHSTPKNRIKTDTQTATAWRKLRNIRSRLDIPHGTEAPMPSNPAPSPNLQMCSKRARALFMSSELEMNADMTSSGPGSHSGSSDLGSSIPGPPSITGSLPSSRDEFGDAELYNLLDISELVAWSASLTDEPSSSSSYDGDMGEPMYGLSSLPNQHPSTYHAANFGENFQHFLDWTHLGGAMNDIAQTASLNGNCHGDPEHSADRLMNMGHTIGDGGYMASSHPGEMADEGKASDLLSTMIEGW